MTTELDFEEIEKMLEEGGFEPEVLTANLALMRRWLKRGDGIAVYQCVALDSAEMGQRKYMSYGSSSAMLKPDVLEDGLPPTRMPDVGRSPGWKYRLEGHVPRGGGHEP